VQTLPLVQGRCTAHRGAHRAEGAGRHRELLDLEPGRCEIEGLGQVGRGDVPDREGGKRPAPLDDILIVGELLGGPWPWGLKQVVQQAFQKKLR